MEPLVSIIIVNYKGWEDTIECIESLQYLEYGNYHVIIVDNSPDLISFQKISDWLSKFSFLGTHVTLNESAFSNYGFNDKFVLIKTENKGFAHANNVALRRILEINYSNYVWLLNNDTVVHKKALENLLKGINSEIWVVGSVLLYYNDRQIIQAAGGCFNQFFGIGKHYLEGSILNNLELSTYLNKDVVQYPVGASMLIENNAFRKIGLLEENYFLYYEEIDFILRLSAINKSFRIATNSLVYHKEGRSIGSGTSIVRSKLADLLTVRNRICFTSKFYPYYIPLVYLGIAYSVFKRIKEGRFIRAWNLVLVSMGIVKKQSIFDVK